MIKLPPTLADFALALLEQFFGEHQCWPGDGHVLLRQRAGRIQKVLFRARDITGAKLEMLDRLPIRLLGAVLNDVPRGAAYGYYAYYSYYLPGYEAVEEGNGHHAAAPRVV